MSVKLRSGKRSSLPSLGLSINKFFVNKRASMFENQEETPQEKRNRSPCGVLETSERKMQMRKDQERKKTALARRRRRMDPYADCSSGGEGEDVDTVLCPHVARAVRAPTILKVLRNPALRLGHCVTCCGGQGGVTKKTSLSPKEPKKKLSSGGVTKKKKSSAVKRPAEVSPFLEPTASVPATPEGCVWLCLGCGVQGCDRSGRGHAHEHATADLPDLHCVAVSLTHWTVWCYECDCEAIRTHSKKLYELVNHIERKYEEACVPPVAPSPGLAGGGSTPNLLAVGEPAPARCSRSVTRTLSASSFSPEPARTRGSSASHLGGAGGSPSAPPGPVLKGILNLGNICFLNSVLQALTHTQPLTAALRTQVLAGQRSSLPGNTGQGEDSSDCDEIELKPLEVILSEGGPLSLAMASFFKEMTSTMNKNPLVHPGFLMQQVNKRSSQFQAAEEPDAQQLLRCLLDGVRAEEVTRVKRAILRAFALNEKIDPLKVPPRTRKIIQGYGKQATHTVVEQVFGGQLITTVVCEECKQITQEFENFTDICLEVIEDRGKMKHLAGTSASGAHFQNRKNRRTKHKSKGQSRRKNLGGTEKKMSEELKSRLSEKRTPEDDEIREKKESARVPTNGLPTIVIDDEKDGKRKTIESSKYKDLVAARAARLKKDEDMGRGESEEEGGFTSGEQEEYDYDQDDEISRMNRQKWKSTCSLFGSDVEETSLRDKAVNNKNVIMSRLNSLCRSGSQSSKLDGAFPFSNRLGDGSNYGNSLTVSYGRGLMNHESTTEESEEETSSEEETGSDDTTCSGEIEETDVTTVTKENEDADVEDNADSEAPEGFPSILVEEGAEACPDGGGGNFLTDSRYLSTLSASCDHLNYNSASDTSELYFTADGNGYDTPRRRYQSKDSLARTDDELPPHFRRGDSAHNRRSVETIGSYRSCDRLSEETEEDSYSYSKYRNMWLSRSATPLAPRHHPLAPEHSVTSSLHRFTAPQLLTGGNRIPCANCTAAGAEALSAATQHRMLVTAPPVLTLHLRRFLKNAIGQQKCNTFVPFPLVLDMSPYTAAVTMHTGHRLLYGLYAVVQHSGRPRGGHYTAFVRPRTAPPATPASLAPRPLDLSILERKPPPREPVPSPDVGEASLEELEAEVRGAQWQHISDECVAPVALDKVLRAQAYLLFYERLV